MDKVTIIQELLAEVGGMQQQLEVMKTQLEVMKQRLMLAEVSMQADAAALQVSQLRVKQLEIMVENQRSQATASFNENTHPQPTVVSVEPQVEKPVEKPVVAPVEETPKVVELQSNKPTTNVVEIAERKDARLIGDLRKAIGLNDRFRLKHDLFDNNETLLFETIDALNSLSCMADADAYLKERFAWKADDATVVYFYEILERKFVRS